MELRELPAALQRLGRDVDDGSKKATAGMRDELATRIPQRTPVGATGQHRAGWRRVPGRPGELSLVGSGPAMAVLEAGRGRGRSGKLRGSRQAPRGIVRPELRTFEPRGERHIDTHLGRVFE